MAVERLSGDDGFHANGISPTVEARDMTVYSVKLHLGLP